MAELLLAEDLVEYFKRRQAIIREELQKAPWFNGSSLKDALTNEKDWRKRLRLWKFSYQICDRLYAEGVFDWMCADPYFIADFRKVLTPIEWQMWEENRANGLRLWPQLPVGRFFVDFGNPVLKIAVECDGKDYHDPDKDAIRDAELRTMGWTVYRASGALCNRIIREPDLQDFDYAESEWLAAHEQWENQTLGGIVNAIRTRVDEYQERKRSERSLPWNGS